MPKITSIYDEMVKIKDANMKKCGRIRKIFLYAPIKISKIILCQIFSNYMINRVNGQGLFFRFVSCNQINCWNNMI